MVRSWQDIRDGIEGGMGKAVNRSEASKEQRRQYDRNKRVLFVAHCLEYLGGFCVDCGTNENLELSHNDPRLKDFNPRRGSGYHCDWETIIRPELDKCSLRCTRCHLIYDGKHPEPEHGDRVMYDLGCRCDICRGAVNKYNRENWWKRRHGNDQVS
jgi:hypothetical protein